ncbi:MAG: GNAT family N-acetyltransferase, partial [Candidatus Omnitrophica bacterium]|nr:GNAT family N-acetyltransferase [Candidatus Omnitrophota bacterium]
MDKIKNSGFFRVISLILIVTFISLDIAYAYPPEHNPGNFTLATPSLLQQQPINEQMARFQQSVFSQGALLASVYDIGEYFFGRPERKVDALPSKYAEEVVKAGLGKILGDSGIEILNIVPVEYFKEIVPEKLNSALSEIGFKGTLPDEGVAFILYEKDGKKFLVQIAEKAKVSANNLPGYEWVVSDKYVVKYMPEGYEVSPAQVVEIKEEPKAPAYKTSSASSGIEEISIVEASMADLSDLFKVREKYFKEELKKKMSYSQVFNEDAFRGELESIIRDKEPGAVVIACAKGSIVGYAVSQRAAQNVGEISEVSVRPDYRRRGNEGKKLLRENNLYLTKALFAKALDGLGKSSDIEVVFIDDYSPGDIMSRLARYYFGFQEAPESHRISTLKLKDVSPAKDPEGNIPNLVATSNIYELEKIGVPAISVLVKRLDDRCLDIRRFAAEALDNIGWKYSNIREEIVYQIAKQNWERLAEIGMPAIPALINVLGETAYGNTIHYSVAEVLGKIGKPAIPTLIKALGNNNGIVCLYAAKALGNIGPEARGAIPALIKILEYNNSSVWYSAAEALGKIGPEARGAIPALITALG